jgi:hypothetical protein
VPNVGSFPIDDLNQFHSFNGVSLPEWKGGKQMIDLPVTQGYPEGDYIVNLMQVIVGEKPIKATRTKSGSANFFEPNGTPLQYSFHVSLQEPKADGYINYEFGCVGKAALASKDMPISIVSNQNRVIGIIRFKDYDGSSDTSVTLSLNYDENFAIQGTIQGYYRDNQFSNDNLFRTDTFSSQFDENGKLTAKPSVVFQPDSTGCDVFINLTIVNKNNSKSRIRASSKLMELLVE